MNKLRWTEEQVAEMGLLYEKQKYGIDRIAKKFQCSRETVKAVLLEQKIEIRKPGRIVNVEESQLIVDLHESGMTQDAIAEKLHRPQSTISYALLKAGVETRQHGRPRQTEREVAMCQFYLECRSQTKTARRFCCSQSWVSQILTRNGISCK